MVKVSVMGSTGVIGKNVTFKLARADTISEVVLFSRPESIDKAKGQSYDMYDALAAEDIDCLLTPSCDYEDLADSQIVLISAGAPRQEGMSRRDLAFVNGKIVSNYARQVAKYAPDAIIVVATNPVDVMTTIALDASGFDRDKVIGVGNHSALVYSAAAGYRGQGRADAAAGTAFRGGEGLPFQNFNNFR